MIIKMSVGDNDFSNELLAFVDTFPRKPDDSFINRNLQKLLDIDDPTRITNEDKKFVCSEIRKLWIDFVDTLDCHKVTKNYLRRDFKVSIKTNFRDMWENYENLYYFSYARRFVIQ